MSQVQDPQVPNAEVALERGTYELIRQRLTVEARDLRERLGKLDQERRDVFGSIPTELLSTQRVTTENNCVPRDLVAVGKHFLFGYNVHLGLRSETTLQDVLAVVRFDDAGFHAESLALLEDRRFLEDFRQLYKYYKATTFAKFHLNGPHLHLVFRVGKSVDDIKSFKWAIVGERLVYVDNRSEHEVRVPAQHEFEWKRTTRDAHRPGRNPHVSIEDRVFVETVGGDLTIKVEDNTDSGEGILTEPVEDRDQTLDDAEIHYAIVGHLILLKIRPYKEKAYRHFIFNEKLRRAIRLDSLQDACVLLPEGHGLIFSNGYYLQSGDYKRFETAATQLQFERRIAAPNGEDHLYVFHNRDSGDYVLLSYNMISQRVENPILCHGWSLFGDGQLLLFRGDGQPQRHHAVQIWRTPYVGLDFPVSGHPDAFLFKIGNRDVVRAMSELQELINLADKDDSYANLYLDIVRLTTDLIDSYFWLSDPKAHGLGATVSRIRETATAAVEEFDKVVRVRRATRTRCDAAAKEAREAISDAASRMYQGIDDFVASLGALRKVRGEIISLRELKYVDLAEVDRLEKDVAENSDRISQRCVQFLLRPDSLIPYEKRVADRRGRIEALPTVSAANELGGELEASATELEMLIEVVSNLRIDDATQRTRIVDAISSIYSQLNQTRATLRKRIQSLRGEEGAAEFHAQIKLLSQATANYLDVADSPQRVDEYLTKLMVQVEELEGRFAEFDEFVLQLTERREEIYAAFDARRLALVEARNRRAASLQQAADRILKGIATRVASFKSVADINAYFASDLMIEKVRELCGQLTALEDSVKVDEIQGRLKTVREDAIRQLRDRQELFESGENVIRLGRHRFSVNVQPLELTTLLKEDSQYFHLTGTAFQERIEDAALNDLRDVWQQEFVSESREVYRAEYLAWIALRNGEILPGESVAFLDLEPVQATAAVQRLMAPRYAESYVKGVHDHDAAELLGGLWKLERQIGHLRFPTIARGIAKFFWLWGVDEEQRAVWKARIHGAAAVRQVFPKSGSEIPAKRRLADSILAFMEQVEISAERMTAESAAGFLFDQLATSDVPGVHHHVAQLTRSFRAQLERRSQTEAWRRSLAAFGSDVAGRIATARHWAEAYLLEFGSDSERVWLEEMTAASLDEREPVALHGETVLRIQGLLGDHTRVVDGGMELDYHEFTGRLSRFERERVPRFESYQHLKKRLLDGKRDEMRLSEFKPRVLTSFVRNRLIDEVYLPLIGDNLAKQMGAVGAGKRTDLMGLLLLISPPGYGKTTLMEYVANRLGLTFMKINGPAIGHQVTSLDPAEAPNASAREEVEKLNLALEMGDNVMIYLDDIQHCDPEFLQKFISLCDGSRRIEGVYRGRTRTYDLRGRKVCVVMAGNPYTESGSQFRIPDMLANRADTYNLGDVAGEHAEAFERSYLENALSSNSVLQLLQSRSRADLETFLRMAEKRAAEGTALEGNYTADEIAEIVGVLEKLLRVRDVLLKVNACYIASAAQADEYRTEPPFRLQGSYRDMNKIAERVVPMMNDKELEAAIMNHYENQAQTLTTGAEANLLKFKELMAWLEGAEAERWAEIKRTFKRNLLLGGVGGDDRVGQVLAQLTVLGEGLHGIRDTLEKSARVMMEGERKPQATANPLDPMQITAHHLASGVQVLGEIGGKLDTIREAFKESQQVRDREAAIVSGLPQSPAETRSSEVQASTAISSIPTSIEVVNKVPRQFMDVIRAQFQVLQSWFEPLIRVTELRGVETEQLRRALQESIDRYRELMAKIGERDPAEG